MAFTWGVEFETNLIYHDPNGKNRETLWERDQLKITSELWDVKLHQPDPNTGKYWVKGYPEKDTVQKLYNLEAQIGVFQGFDMQEFDQCVKKLDKKLKDSVAKKRFKIGEDTKYTLFGYDNMSSPEGLFLDRHSDIPGAYPDGDNWVGYREELFEHDIVGKPQLTMGFNLSYLPKLFNLLKKYYPEEFSLDHSNWVMKKWALTKTDHELYGFILYLFHYYGRYLQYMKNKEAHHYFKTVFWIKPRTNPSSLYASLTKHQRKKIKELAVLLDDIDTEKNDERKKYIQYLRTILRQLHLSLKTKDCVYSSGIAGINNSLYHYDKESLEMYFAMEEYSDHVTGNHPCIDPYEEDEDKDPLPSLSYDGDEFVASSGFTSVWEWKSTGKGEIVYEFRDMQDLLWIALDGQDDTDHPIYQSFFKFDMYTPSQLSEMITIIFQSFVSYVFSDDPDENENNNIRKEIRKESRKKSIRKKSIRKESIRKESVRKESVRKESVRKESVRKESIRKSKNKTTEKTKIKIKIKTKCQEGKNRSRVTGRCRLVKKKKSNKKCQEGKRRSRVTKRCRSVQTKKSVKKCGEGKHRSRVTGRCRLSK